MNSFTNTFLNSSKSNVFQMDLFKETKDNPDKLGYLLGDSNQYLNDDKVFFGRVTLAEVKQQLAPAIAADKAGSTPATTGKLNSIKRRIQSGEVFKREKISKVNQVGQNTANLLKKTKKRKKIID